MANRHFGNIGDVWKHVVLAEVLEREPPAWYAETHAGSGAYPVVHSGGREYGFLRFLEVAPRFPVLARSRYRAIAASYVDSDRRLYPGSALLAMTCSAIPPRTCCVISTGRVSLIFAAGHANLACITARWPKPTAWRPWPHG